jgi:hypothetical protein
MSYDLARKIVCEEWHRAVMEFGLKPGGSPVETTVARILTRLDREALWLENLKPAPGQGEENKNG